MIEMPLLLAGLVAAAVPIIIHLLHRHRTTPISWGAMIFLEESSIQQKRRRTIEEWLLLLLRIALLALLALLLARPILAASRLNPFFSHASSDIAVVMDHSILSGMRTGDGTEFQKQIKILRGIISRLHHGDTLSVILAQHRPLSLSRLPLSAGDTSEIRRKFLDVLLHRHPGLTGSSIPQAIALARHLVNHGSNFQKVIFVLSSQRAIAWKVNHPSIWKQTMASRSSGPGKLLVYSVPLEDGPNLSNISVSSIHIEPSLIGAGRPIQLSVALSNSGPLPFSNIPLQFLVNGKLITERVVPRIAAGKSLTISFSYRFENPGSHWLKVQANVHDALAADNQILATVNVRQHLPVLIIDSHATSAGGFRASRFLNAALQPFDPALAQHALIQPQVVSISAARHANLFAFDAVVVNDTALIPHGLLARLGQYARAGHGVWFILGRNSTPQFVNNSLPAAGFSIGSLGSIRQADKSPVLVIKNPQNPIVRVLAALDRNVIVGVTLQKWWQLQTHSPMVRVLLATADGDSLVVERTVGIEGGRVVVWTTPVDGSWNDWPTDAGSFVPLVNQTIYALALGGTRRSRRDFLKPGEAIVWTGPITPTIQSAQVSNPHGVVLAAQPQITSGNKYLMIYHHTESPGLYQLNFKPAAIPQPVFYSVAIDPRQLDPQTLSKNDIIWLEHQGYVKAVIKPAGIISILSSTLTGLDLWPWLAALVMLMLIIEVFLCHRLLSASAAELKSHEVTSAIN